MGADKKRDVAEDKLFIAVFAHVCVFACVWGSLIVQLVDCVWFCVCLPACVSLWGQKKMMKGSSVDGRHC